MTEGTQTMSNHPPALGDISFEGVGVSTIFGTQTMSDKLTIELRHSDLAYSAVCQYYGYPEDSDCVSRDCAEVHIGALAAARFEASLRTPTPEQAGEVGELIRAIHNVAAPDTGQCGMTLEGDEVEMLSAYLRASTPPAQPTADAVERVKATGWTRLHTDELPDDGTDYESQEPGWRIHDFPENSDTAYWICGGLEEADAKAFVSAINSILAIPTTMAGDYVMVPREMLTEQIEHIETRIQDGRELGATVWRLALEDIVREHRALIAASPTGGE